MKPLVKKGLEERFKLNSSDMKTYSKTKSLIFYPLFWRGKGEAFL
jgi:hypothetical protein